jgi:hypothetical protein
VSRVGACIHFDTSTPAKHKPCHALRI